MHVHSQATDEALVEVRIDVDQKTVGTTVARRVLVALRQEERVRRITGRTS